MKSKVSVFSLLILLIFFSFIEADDVSAQDMENPYQVKKARASSLMPDNASYIVINLEQYKYRMTKRALEDGAVIDEYSPQFPENTDSHIAISPNGNYAAICGFDVKEEKYYATEIVVYDLLKKQNVEKIDLRNLQIGSIWSIAFNSSGDVIFFSAGLKNYMYKLNSGTVKNIPGTDNYRRIASTTDNRIILAALNDKGNIKRLSTGAIEEQYGASRKGKPESLYIFSFDTENVSKLNSLKEVNINYFSSDFDLIEAKELFPSINFETLKSASSYSPYAFSGKQYILHKASGGIIIYDYNGKIKILQDGSPEALANREISVRFKFAEKFPDQYAFKGSHLKSSFMVTSKEGLITEFRGTNSTEKQIKLTTVAQVDDKRIEIGAIEFPYSRAHLSKLYCNAVEKMFTSEPEYTHYFLGKSSYNSRHYFVFNDMSFGFNLKQTSVVSIREMLEIDRDESTSFSIEAVRRLSNNNILIVAKIGSPYQAYPLFLNEDDKAFGKFMSDSKVWVNSYVKFVILSPGGEKIIGRKSYLLTPLSYMVDETGFYVVTHSISKPVECRTVNSQSLLTIGKQITAFEGGGIAMRNKNGGVAVVKFNNDLKPTWHKVIEEWSDYNIEPDIFGTSFIMGGKVYVHTINYKQYITNKPYQMLTSFDKNAPTEIERSFGNGSNFIMLLNSIDNKPIRINYDFRHESRDKFIPDLVGADQFKERIQYVDLTKLFPNK